MPPENTQAPRHNLHDIGMASQQLLENGGEKLRTVQDSYDDLVVSSSDESASNVAVPSWLPDGRSTAGWVRRSSVVSIRFPAFVLRGSDASP
jgi:hypothetical protein